MPPKSRKPPKPLRRVSGLSSVQSNPNSSRQVSGSSNAQSDPNSSRRVSGSSNPQSDRPCSQSDELDLTTDVENSLNEENNQRSKQARKKKIQRLMNKVSSKIPEGPSGLNGSDRRFCLQTIQKHLQGRNPVVLGFLALVEGQSFNELLLCVRTFSTLVLKDKIMNPETLTVHDSCDARMLLSQLKSVTTIEPMELPTPENYNVVKRLMETFNSFFDQSSEQSAVIKVAAYSVLVHLQNENLCTKYFPEFSLFTINRENSAAEVVARVNMHDYRYFLTGRADGFIVSLTVEKEKSWSILPDEEVKGAFSEACEGLVVPKYRALDGRLRKLIQGLNLWERANQRVSYEIVILEVKSLQPPVKIGGDELKNHLKQVIGECAAIHECGPDKSKFVKFILSDGDHWLFGVLQNPEINAVGFDTVRECVYATLDNSDLKLVEQTTELLAVWMAIPGNILFDSFHGIKKEVVVKPGASKLDK